MLNSLRNEFRLAEQQESNVCDGGALDIIVDIRDSEFE